jgi:hypothetical protein
LSSHVGVHSTRLLLQTKVDLEKIL